MVLGYIAAVFVLFALNFFLPRTLPGRPLEALSDPRAATYIGDAERRAAVERYYGLDQPNGEQFVRYLGGLGRGELGTSIRYNVSVSTLLAGKLPWTLLLTGTALTVAAVVGMLAGVQAGWRRGRASDRGLLPLFVAFDNIPLYFLGSAVAYVFAVQLGWLPLSGARTPFSESWPPWQQALDIAYHLVLPAGLMAMQFAGFQFLVMRASMVGELGSDYLMLGRAKGLPERVLKYRYAARNALLPAVSVLALQAGFAVTASIFIETIFAYPGLGRLMVESVQSRDYPTMQGVFLVFTVIVLTANLLADLAYRRLDPTVSR
ncbi:MAG: ABC transporter permease [Gemmatimonadales bacterium]|nr:ABC transporter permease [Gemmatimonadales bacterium]